MTTFNQTDCYVWIWLPNASSPIVCGKLESTKEAHEFFYGANYRANTLAIPLDQATNLNADIRFTSNDSVHHVINDSMPDAWGQRVLLHRYKKSALCMIDMLTLSSSDRIGALHFQKSPDDYQPTIRKSCRPRRVN